MVGALDAEQVVVRRLGQRGVARGRLQNGLGDHDRRVQIVLCGDGAGRLAHQRDELLGGEVLAVVARHVGRVVDVREGDGRHRDGHLLERRLGLPLDGGGCVRLVGHPAGIPGLLDAVINRVICIDDRLVRRRGLIGIGGLGRVGRIRGVDGIDRIDRVDGINRFTRIIGVDGIGRVGRILRVNGVRRIRRVSRSRRLVRVGRRIWIRRINGIGRICRIHRVSRPAGFNRIRRRFGSRGLLHAWIIRIRHLGLNRRLRLLGYRRGFHGIGLRLWLRRLGFYRNRLVIGRQVPQLRTLLFRQITELPSIGRHVIDAGLIKGLTLADPRDGLFVAGRNIVTAVVLNGMPIAVLGVAGGVRCGHAAHRGNDQRRSSENRYCLPR